MSRHLPNVAFFLVGFIFSAFAGYLHAETIPATGSYQWKMTYHSAIPWGDQEAVCKAYLAIYGYVYERTEDNGNGTGACRYHSTGDPGWSQSAPMTRSVTRNYSCPVGQNWTVSGATCRRPDCVAPQTRQSDGTCAVSCIPPEVKQADGSCKSSCWSCVITPSGSCIKPSTCGAGTGPESFQFALASQACGAPCSDSKSDPAECPNGGIKLGTFEGKPLCLTKTPQDDACTAIGGTVIGTMDGKPVCSKAGANPKCPDGSDSEGSVNGQPVCRNNGACPQGTGQITVNGQSSCVPINPVTDKTTDQKGKDPANNPKNENEQTVDPNGNPVGTGKDKTTDESTTCVGERCTTKTITTDNGNGEKTTKVTEQSKDDFCKSNPKSSLCTGTSDQSSYCKENPNAVSCLSAGDVAEEGALTQQAAGVSSITLVSIASNETCPSPITLPVGQISWQPICDAASWLKPLILAFAWLAAGLIVLGKVD